MRPSGHKDPLVQPSRPALAAMISLTCNENWQRLGGSHCSACFEAQPTFNESQADVRKESAPAVSALMVARLGRARRPPLTQMEADIARQSLTATRFGSRPLRCAFNAGRSVPGALKSLGGASSSRNCGENCGEHFGASCQST